MWHDALVWQTKQFREENLSSESGLAKPPRQINEDILVKNSEHLKDMMIRRWGGDGRKNCAETMRKVRRWDFVINLLPGFLQLDNERLYISGRTCLKTKTVFLNWGFALIVNKRCKINGVYCLIEWQPNIVKMMMMLESAIKEEKVEMLEREVERLRAVEAEVNIQNHNHQNN